MVREILVSLESGFRAKTTMEAMVTAKTRAVNGVNSSSDSDHDSESNSE